MCYYELCVIINYFKKYPSNGEISQPAGGTQSLDGVGLNLEVVVAKLVVELDPVSVDSVGGTIL